MHLNGVATVGHTSTGAFSVPPRRRGSEILPLPRRSALAKVDIREWDPVVGRTTPGSARRVRKCRVSVLHVRRTLTPKPTKGRIVVKHDEQVPSIPSTAPAEQAIMKHERQCAAQLQTTHHVNLRSVERRSRRASFIRWVMMSMKAHLMGWELETSTICIPL